MEFKGLLYKIINKISGSIYIGITRRTIKYRFDAHKRYAKTGRKTPLYDAMRSYGFDSFYIEIINEYDNLEKLYQAEIDAIAFYRSTTIHVYNILNGGKGDFKVWREPTLKEDFIKHLKIKRVGRKPSLGMKHTDENKKIFGKFGEIRWDKYGRYPIDEILKYNFVEANKKYGVSRTHYYRIKNGYREVSYKL